MTSIKWTTVSFLAAASLGAGALAFAGCTVTSGNPDDSPGTVKDGGGGTDSATTDGNTPTTCNNPKQKQKFISDACQTCLNTNCCTQLQACFNKVPGSAGVDGGADGGADGGVTNGDCNEYAECVAFCYDKQGGAKSCLDECNAGAPDVVNEYDAIISCAAAKPDCKTACNIQ